MKEVPSSPSCTDCLVRSLHGFCPGFSPSGTVEACWRGQRDYPAKTVVIREGEAIGELMFLRAGWAANFRLMADGRRQIIAFKLPGDPLNGQALVADRAFDSLQALTPITTCAFERNAFVQTTAKVDKSERGNRGILSWTIRALHDRVMTLNARTGVEAMGSLFLDFHARLKRRGLTEDGAFDCPISQDHIADALGITKVHVSRTLAVLRKEGLFEFRNQRAKILDYEGLCRRTGYVASEPRLT